MIPFAQLKRRAAIIQAVRRFFTTAGFLEVDTPLRLPAIAPEQFIEPLTSAGSFLQTSPELCMKRLLAAGSGDIFQICKCFRAAERGRRHLPEFTMLEWYRARGDYHDLMADCQGLFSALAAEVIASVSLKYRGKDIQISNNSWPKLTVAEAFRRYADIEVAEAMARDIFAEKMVSDIEPHLGFGQPLFLVDYPAPMASLARLKADNQGVGERFELYVAGLEIANGFSELHDPAEQRRRFELERQYIKDSGRDPGPMPEKFLSALPDMGPAAGIALGLDRLVMLFCGADDIDAVVSFRPEEL